MFEILGLIRRRLNGRESSVEPGVIEDGTMTAMEFLTGGLPERPDIKQVNIQHGYVAESLEESHEKPVDTQETHFERALQRLRKHDV